MRKREQGVLTVEASIVLTLCVMLMLFLFSFARVYSAQSLVSHAVIQSSDAVALESYLREETLTGSEADVAELSNRFLGTTSVSADTYTSLRSADVPKTAKEKFVYAIGKNEAEADEKLKKLGVKSGLAGVDFSGSYIDLGNDDVIVYVSYTIEMQFGIFGMDGINVTKAAKSKTFGDILFGISVVAEDPKMGSGLGSGSYRHGTQIQISAAPKYGYKFTKWADGSTANPRTVTVTGEKKYVAIFEASEFGINLVSSPNEGGAASGGGIYKYLDSVTVTAIPSNGYRFTKWSVYSHKDEKTRNVSSQAFTLTVDQSYTCTANFTKNSYRVSVETSGLSGGNAYIVYNGRNSTSVTALYQDSFKLVAPSVSGYKFLGWKEKGSGNYFSSAPSVMMKVPASAASYVACYENTVRTVNFYNYDGSLYATRRVNSGRSLGSDMPSDPHSVGHIFNGWQSFDRNTAVYDNMNVYGSWSNCTRHVCGNCNEDHGIKAQKLNSHPVSGYTITCRCIVCAKCGSYLKYRNGRWQTTGSKKWTASNGEKIEIGENVWCITHRYESGGTGYCSSYMNSKSAGEYPVHPVH